MPDSQEHLPQQVYSAAQVRELDSRLIAAGTSGYELMQRAAHAGWRALRQQWPAAGCLTVLAGRGNNAGDGYLIAALAQRAGWQVQVLAVGAPAQLQGDAQRAHAEALASGVVIQPWSECAPLQGVLVDALLGTGLQGAVREPYAQAIRLANASDLPIVAVDIPSGLCADTGCELGVAIRASLTVTFVGLKLGLFTGAGPDRVGRLEFAELQADPLVRGAVATVAERLAAGSLTKLPPRRRTTHKGQLGHLLVIGGDRGFAGAALLAAESALRAGAGLVSLATRGEHVAAALARRPELMCAPVASANQLYPLVAAADVLVVGPGLGQMAWGRSLLSAAINGRQVQVWDADALNLLAAGQASLPAGAVLTPHPGEAARLLGCSAVQVQADRPAAAQELARRYQAVIVLKGAGTLIASPQGQLAVCSNGHPAMAGAGFGDVLAGLIGALLAQGLPAYAAACLAVWLHARAGEQLALLGRGMAASDLLPAIREQLEVFSPCLV
ncbi:NAD(P)H-hydrate epimerase [Pseudomonas pohangensis]|uniref:Bifunctional NAD(P)H-hydrate repair enzyme n=1 Tax=Pseudomonas pohangensis TaxID=364197 RepID=A0A1H2H308_9PSED|nr:NAD(P)H-hydrate dehydratase [Pseudomonas pohangensis]SDU26241.1 NAD(P)H-hydrate epimerase [Pseudomonas pohangensis]